MHARFALILGCTLAMSSSALAQNLQNSDDGYLAPKLVLGLGGEGELEVDALGGIAGDYDLELTYGFGVAYMAPLHKYFALGGQLIIASWQPEYPNAIADDIDRNSYLDLSLVPQVKYAVSDRVELYASLPLGLTFDFFGENELAGAEINSGFGFNLALMLGARFAIGDSWGLLAELGYVYHSFTHGTEAAGQEGPDFEISLGQVGLNLGAWFSL